MLILYMSCGIWALNGIKSDMTNIWILSQMLQLKCGNPSGIQSMKAIKKANWKVYYDPFDHK